MGNNNGRVIAIIALVVAVIALSIGFAAFADDLTITGNAVLEKNDVFEPNVRYVTSSATCVYDDGNNTNAITTGYSAGTLDDDTWTGISVPLKNEEGKKKVICTAQVENQSAYDAYLTSIASSSGLTCAAADASNDPVTNLSDVCGTNNANVKATVIIGDSQSSTDKIEIQNAQVTNSSTTGKIDKKNDPTVDTTNVYVIFEYLGTAEPDGNVLITLPTITHHYSTANPNA